jgi:hypothetical protein
MILSDIEESVDYKSALALNEAAGDALDLAVPAQYESMTCLIPENYMPGAKDRAIENAKALRLWSKNVIHHDPTWGHVIVKKTIEWVRGHHNDTIDTTKFKTLHEFLLMRVKNAGHQYVTLTVGSL